MLPFFLIFAPGLLSAAIHRALKQKPMSNFDFLVSAMIYAFFIAAFAFGVIYLRGFDDLAPLAVFDNLRSVAKYCAISAVSAVALPNVFYLEVSDGKRPNSSESIMLATASKSSSLFPNLYLSASMTRR